MRIRPTPGLILTVGVMVSVAAWSGAADVNRGRLLHTRALLAAPGDRAALAVDAHQTAEALAMRIDDSRAQALVGAARYTAGDYRGALEALTRAVALDPDDVVSREQWADVLFRTGDVAAAIDQWRRAGAGQAVAHRGRTAAEAGDVTTATAYLALWPRVDPSNVEAWLGLAQWYLDRGDTPAARQTYEALIAAHPTSSLGYARLADLWVMRLGRRDEALDVLARGSRVAPGAALSDARARLLVSDGRLEEAEEAAKTAVALEPGNATYRLALGDLLRRRGQYDAAIAQYRAALVSPNRALRWLVPSRIGQTYRASGQPTAAVEAHQAAIAAATAGRVDAATLAAEYEWLGEALREAGQPGPARAALAEAAALRGR